MEVDSRVRNVASALAGVSDKNKLLYVASDLDLFSYWPTIIGRDVTPALLRMLAGDKRLQRLFQRHRSGSTTR